MKESLRWIKADEPLPDASTALTDPPGLVAAGLDLSTDRLDEAYRKGIFPWFSDGQPVLWWSPDPRMVLYTDELHLSQSLKKKIATNRAYPNNRIATHHHRDHRPRL